MGSLIGLNGTWKLQMEFRDTCKEAYIDFKDSVS